MADQVKKEKKKRKLSEIRIGEFLAALDVVPPSKLRPALRLSQSLGLPLGRTLVVRGLVSNEELSNLLELHSMFKRGTLDFHNVSEAYEMSKRRGWRVKEALQALGCATDDIETVRLGELLVDAELLDKSWLEDALELQTLCGLPLGRILSLESRVPEQVVTAALEFQTGIRTNTMKYEEAVDKLKMMPFLMNTDSIRPVIEMDIKSLLVGGRICTELELAPALSFAEANNKPLEEILAKYDWANRSLILASLALTKLVQRGYITAQEALSFLNKVSSGEIKPKKDDDGRATAEMKIISADINLYKLLIASGYLTPDKIRLLTKKMINNEKEFGELIGREIDETSPRKDVRQAIIDCFATDDMLSKILIEYETDLPPEVVRHACNLVELVALGGATLEQALLSFAWCRRDLKEKDGD